MISQYSLILMTVLMLCSMSSGHIGGIPMNQYISPQVYCGRTLARALALFCMDNTSEKRSDEGTMYNPILLPYYKDEDNQIDWPWISHHKAKAMGENRVKRYIVNECCEKPCSINELKSYC